MTQPSAALQPATTPHVAWIDVARGLGMVMIVAGHAYIPGREDGPVFTLLYAVHVPLFFVLSGMVFAPSRHTIDTFARTRTRRLIIPYLVWAAISAALFLILGRMVGSSLGRPADVSLTSSVIGILVANPSHGGMRWNTPLWFLGALLIAQALSWLMWHMIERWNAPRWSGLVIAIGLAVMSYVLLTPLMLPWSIDRALLLFPFFELGVAARPKIALLDRVPKAWAATVGAALLVAMAGVATHNGTVDYVNETYGDPVLWALAAALGIAGMMGVASGLRDIRPLAFLGAASLTVLVLHKFALIPLQIIASRTLPRVDPVLGNGAPILLGVIATLTCALLYPLLRMTIPWAIGLPGRRQHRGAP